MRGVTWREAALAAVVAGLVVLSALTAPPSRIELDGLGYALLLVGAAAVAAHRIAPVAVLVVTAAVLLPYAIVGYPGVSPAVPVMVALYAVVRSGRPRIAAVTILIILVAGVGGQAAVSGTGPELFQRWFLLIGWMVASAVMGAYLEQAERRALEAERTREEEAVRRADAERVRIARELHDSLTHCISIIKVQAGVAVHLNRKRDEPVPEALVAIELAAGEAMRELRATLEALRADTDRPGLDRLENLLDGARRAGTPVTLTVDGTPPAVPAADVDRAAYRIVQEALTNVARHAGAATASVELSYHQNHITVRVDDYGHGSPRDGGGLEGTRAGSPDGVGGGGRSAGDGGPGGGHGLAGMRERVAALGGTLDAGPRDDGGGFRVQASLPLDPGRERSPA